MLERGKIKERHTERQVPKQGPTYRHLAAAKRGNSQDSPDSTSATSFSDESSNGTSKAASVSGNISAEGNNEVKRRVIVVVLKIHTSMVCCDILLLEEKWPV